MVEKTLLDWLGAAIAEPVYMEEPVGAPERFVLLEKTSGSKENHISRAMIAAQSYAPTLYEAAELNERVKAAMEAAVAQDEICAVRLNNDYNFTDTETKRYRYQAIFDVTHY